MKEEDILKDSTLEELGLIKKIDTLSIIQKAELLKDKRIVFLNSAVAIVLGLLILSFNILILYFAGIRIFLIIQVLISWFTVVTCTPLYKKKNILGG
jgi:hypothetical protein